MNIDGNDMKMKYPTCYDKVFDSWLVSSCGKVWSISKNSLIKGSLAGQRSNRYVSMGMRTDESFWEDGSGWNCTDQYRQKNVRRAIPLHKMIIDTWAPLYDNPPEGISWEEWEIIRDLPTVYNHISKTGSIDHIDDDPTNNHLDNLRRVNDWDNQPTRKAKGI
jgi:hypothetical protein